MGRQAFLSTEVKNSRLNVKGLASWPSHRYLGHSSLIGG
jgi:predicted transcriptional regulator with HTH domain